MTSIETTVQSVPRASKGTGTPEEVVDELTRTGTDWMVSSEGDLLIKTWQIVAEGFVPKEQVGIIRQRMTSSITQKDEIEWLSKNLNYLRGVFAGKWIAIYENRVVASAINLPDLMIMVKDIDKPFLTQIPDGPLVWNFAYGFKNV